MPSDLIFKSAAELAALLEAKEVSSVELVRAFIARTKAVDGKVRAFNSFDEAGALAQARVSDARRAAGQARGALDGMPVGIKDVIAVAGQPLTASSRMLANFISPYDATVTRKLKDAGAIPWGRLNMDEFAMGSSTENSAFHPTCNPWDLERVPGGSSGGDSGGGSGGRAAAPARPRPRAGGELRPDPNPASVRECLTAGLPACLRGGGTHKVPGKEGAWLSTRACRAEHEGLPGDGGAGSNPSRPQELPADAAALSPLPQGGRGRPDPRA